MIKIFLLLQLTGADPAMSPVYTLLLTPTVAECNRIAAAINRELPSSITAQCITTMAPGKP